jgi:HEAT repeat protein
MKVSVPASEPTSTVQVTASRRGPLWAKLFSLAVIFNALGIAVSVWVARLVRLIPESDSTEQWLRAGYYTAIALAAIFDALLLDELLFKGAFRRTHLVGRIPGALKRDDDVEAVAASMQRSGLSFPFLLVASGLVSNIAFNLVDRDFDGYYRNLGVYLGPLHRGDPGAQIAAVRQLSIRRAPQVVPALRWRMQEGGPAAPWAAWALGRHRDQPSHNPLIAPLVAAVRTGDPALRREATVALGRLQQRSMAPAIQDELRADLQAWTDHGTLIDLRLLYALGAVQVNSSADLLEQVLQRGDPKAQRIAAWAVAQHRDQRGGVALVRILEDRLPTADVELRCAIVHALGIFAHERANLALVRAYDDSTAADLDVLCPRETVMMSPDFSEDGEDMFMPDDALALKILASMGQMRATRPEVRAVVEPWLERRIADEGATMFVREGARVLLSGIREGRNDSTKPTVEEAYDAQKNRVEKALDL